MSRIGLKKLQAQMARGGAALPTTDGLIAYYPMDEGIGTSVADTSGNGRNGTFTGAQWQTGRSGSCANFGNNPGRFLTLPNAVNCNGSQFSFGGWANASDYSVGSNYYGIFSTGISGSPNASGITLYLKNNLLSMFARSGSSNFCNSEYAGLSSPTINTWYHYFLTWATSDYGGDGKLRCYVNGVLSASSAGSTASAMDGNAKPIIGWLQWSYIDQTGPIGNQGWVGGVDDIRIYNRALSAAEILTIYDYEKP